MRRVVSLYLPSWPTDRLRRSGAAPPPDEPLVTVEQDGSRRVLAGVDAAARRLGLRPGMSAAHAQVLIPGLHLAPADAAADRAALVRLGLWCQRYAPLVALDPPDGLLIDVTGAVHLLGGEAPLLDDLAHRLVRVGISARLALADTVGCARAVARFGEGGIVPPGRTAQALADLPVAALGLGCEAVPALQDVGIGRVGQLMDKPRAALRLRFGAEVLFRLDRALGHEPEPLAALAAPEVPQVALRFAEPVGARETLERVVADLCARLVPELERRGLEARRLDLVFVRVDRLDQAIRIGTAKPSRDGAHLARLLTERLSLIDPGFGIEEALLCAAKVEPLAERQGSHLAERPQALDLAALVDTLVVRLGAARVYRLAPVESDLPERVMRRVPALADPLGVVWPADLPRPVRLLAPPEPVTAVAEIPDAPPLFFVWRDIRHRIVRADGPERILGEWWVADAEAELTRDYYRVETEAGERFWLFRDGPMERNGRWWLHGLGEA
ncbi:MAG TPA: DNA polymerase Y family protein [Methylorubrum populi]|uniref:DNA-directed DNA polymerase n=1 Tax=Methylorubrum populi TaxID=223967 RepID=A0A921E2M2_9HYPH|nr:DNA polymerase Y family protein [Methylorubrum populi]